jgi:1-phosphofructokinase family hexose kinase
MKDAFKTIICCGFTPCIQRILEFESVSKGHVNRAVQVTVGIGGKGANTARMVLQLGATVELLGFAGGENGRLLETLLTQEQVHFKHVQVTGETRICQTLIELGNPETTELVEEMPPILSDEWAAMRFLFSALDFSNSVVPISGKLPTGVPTSAYAQIVERVQQQGGQVVIDAPGEPLLQTLVHRPFLVKINDVELLQTLGGTDLLTACAELIRRGAQAVLITRGSRTAFLVDDSGVLELVPPVIDAINPVGSGDAVTAGVAVELSRGKSLRNAVITGMACGAANALNLVSGLLKLDDVARLRQYVGEAD